MPLPKLDTPQQAWPDLWPGQLVEWRQDPRDAWDRARVCTVLHELEKDGEQVYTIVIVALLDERGHRTLGTRTVTGADIATRIRQSR